MRTRTGVACLTLFALAWAGAAQAAAPADAALTRSPDGALVARWTSPDPVDVLVAATPDQPVSRASVVSRADRDGEHVIAPAGAADGARTYILLRDARSGEWVRVAERLVPLEAGSNFRDIGGYAVKGGRHVRWGRIFRSGGTPLLSGADIARVDGLGLKAMVDLRSSEERVLAPSRISGVPYEAVGYSMTALGAGFDMAKVYRGMPRQFIPQLRLVFQDLLRGEAPLVYNCSAGQDRTGFATAIVLSALGASTETILADYHLSTALRRPEYELPRISPETAATNPVAAMFARFQQGPQSAPQPLRTSDGTSYLSFALDEVRREWGSVDNYLQAELGVGPAEIRRLRAAYTE